jgi:hypothetical protein
MVDAATEKARQAVPKIKRVDDVYVAVRRREASKEEVDKKRRRDIVS